MPTDPRALPRQSGVHPDRAPRLAFNADEADCCTCVGECYGRTDGICRCLAPATVASEERADV